MEISDIITLSIIGILGTAVGTLLVERYSSLDKSRKTKKIYKTSIQMIDGQKEYNQEKLQIKTNWPEISKNIPIFGGPASGKTVMLAALFIWSLKYGYGVPTNGSHYLYEICTELRRGMWPTRTDQKYDVAIRMFPSKFDFFKLRDLEIQAFDLPGGYYSADDLFQNSLQKNTDMHTLFRSLYSVFNNLGGLILLIDSKREIDDQSESSIPDHFINYLNILSSYKVKLNKIPIAFVFSKSDMLTESQKKQLQNKLTVYLNLYIDKINIYGIFFISSMGENLEYKGDYKIPKGLPEPEGFDELFTFLMKNI